MKTNMQTGYSVKIIRVDKTAFLCCSGIGVLPPVWRKRKWAVEHRQLLVQNGFNAKVVRVKFTEPKELQ